MNLLLEQTENSLWRKDRELKIAQKKYDELISKVAMLESKYSGFDAIKEANEELQQQVKALQQAVESRDQEVQMLVDTMQRQDVGGRGHMNFHVLGNSKAFPDHRVRILTNFHSWELLNGFYELIVNHEKAAQCINLHGDHALNPERRPNRNRTWTPQDCFLFTVMWMKVGGDMNRMCAWFGFDDAMVRSFCSVDALWHHVVSAVTSAASVVFGCALVGLIPLFPLSGLQDHPQVGSFPARYVSETQHLAIPTCREIYPHEWCRVGDSVVNGAE